MLDDIEQEPAPDPPRSALQKRIATSTNDAATGATSARDSVDTAAGVAKLRLPLLEHAFGAQMLEGRDEWQDVADVIRSSFLVVTKELKRHDKRLRLIETNNRQYHHYRQIDTQRESDAEARWRVLQEQMAPFSDELQLLSQQLQQLKESQDSAHEQLILKSQQLVALELEKSSQKAEERHARLKRRLARLETRPKRAVERAEEVQSSMHTLESNLCAVATDLRDVKLEIIGRVSPKFGILEGEVAEICLRGAFKATGDATGSSSARSDLAVLGDENLRSPDTIRELAAAQAQCKQEIRNLQHALVAHNQRVMTQAKKIKRRVEGMKHPNDANLVVTNQTKQLLTKVEAGNPQPPSEPKEEREAELPVLGIPVTDRELKPLPAPKVAAASVSESHATLKQRFAKARRKQQESLTNCGNNSSSTRYGDELSPPTLYK